MTSTPAIEKNNSCWENSTQLDSTRLDSTGMLGKSQTERLMIQLHVRILKHTAVF